MPGRIFKKQLSQLQHKSYLEYLQSVDLKYEIKLGETVSHDCSVVYFELSDFADISHVLTPEQVFTLFHELYSFISDSVIRFQGLVNKFTLNGVVAFFPRNYRDERRVIVEEALDCITEVMHWFYSTLRKKIEKPEKTTHSFDLSIGIDGGNIYIGHVGSIYHSELILLGDQVICAQQCMGHAEKKEVLIGQDAAEIPGLLYSKFFSEGPQLRVKYSNNTVNYRSKLFDWAEFAQTATWIKKD